MKPHIADLLSMSAQRSPSASVPTSCLPAGMGGRKYTINGELFTSAVDTLVPDYTARFRLFKLSSAGQPLLDQYLGYIDYSCFDADSLLTEARLVSDTVPVAVVTFPAETGQLGGIYRAPDASQTLAFGRLHDDVGILWIKFQIPGFPCDYDFPIAGSGSQSGGAHVARYLAERRDIDFRFEADSLGLIEGGYVLYVDSQLNLAACIESGCLSAPIFTVPTPACNSRYEPMSVNAAQLQAMSSTYIALRALWQTTANLFDICRSLVPE